MESRPYNDLQFRRVADNVLQIRDTARQLRATLDTMRVRPIGANDPGLSRHARTAQRKAAPRLSQHELAILRLIAEGHGNEEIADLLHFGHGTIKLHVRGILEKFDTSSRTVAAVRAVRLGII